MTTINILDTGFLTSKRDGDPKKGGAITSLGDYICNTGSAIKINCAKLSLIGGTNLSADSDPSSNDAAKTAFTTFANDTYTLIFWIDVGDSTERGLVAEINALRKTKGVKLLYASDTASNKKMLPELIGRTDTKFNETSINDVELAGIPLIVCRVSGTQIDNVPSRKYAITGKITFIEEKVVKVDT